MPKKVSHDGECWSNSDEDAVEIRPHDPSWPRQFASEARAIRSALGEGLACKVHHVGSTAVPGLAAKPIIDVILEVPHRDSWPLLVKPLGGIGYAYWDENPDKSKMFFVKGMPPSGTGRTHHIHVYTPDAVEPVLRFRDYLIAHPEEAHRYGALKRRLAVEFARDREGYTRAKDGFVREVLQKSSAPGDVPSPIDFDNVQEVLAWVDETQRKRPWRPEFFRTFASQIAQHFAGPASILELGAGPGLLAEQILGLCSVQRYVLLDFSLPMHSLARDRLKSFESITEYVTKDFRIENWEHGLGLFDACVTMQAVHEVRHKRNVPQLLERIMTTIRAGGYLWVADHYITEHNNPELFFSMDEQPGVLRAAGLEDVTLILDKGNMALYRGRKPS